MNQTALEANPVITLQWLLTADVSRNRKETKIHIFTYKAVLSGTLSYYFLEMLNVNCSVYLISIALMNIHANVEQAKQNKFYPLMYFFFSRFIAVHVSTVSMVISSGLIVWLLICNTVHWDVSGVFVRMHVKRSFWRTSRWNAHEPIFQSVFSLPYLL